MSAPPIPPPRREGRRLLLIDDEESLRYAVAKSLKKAGFVVDTAATGREGVDKLRRGGFDAVVTDMKLPDLSGLDVVAVCTEVDPDLPVLVISGFGTVDSALEAMRRGARNFVEKPFDVARLVEMLEREIAGADASRESRALRAKVERRFAPDRYASIEGELRRAGGGGGGGGGDGSDRAAGPASVAEASSDAAGIVRPAEEPMGLRDAQRKFELRYVEDLLVRTGGNVAAAARLAGISRPNFHKKLKSLGVDPERFKSAHRRGRSAGL